MCCLVTALLLVGPRFTLFIWWLFNSALFTAALGNFLYACLGVIFLPWTLLAYLVVLQLTGNVQGFGWFVVGLGFLTDIAAYTGGGYGNRHRLSRYTRR